ncbi:MAG TPA: hypothetical protein VHC69_24190 [Polyangiaceae bacterium]|nr:hypothetical protein [Polyangiaceae bacterium]
MRVHPLRRRFAALSIFLAPAAHAEVPERAAAPDVDFRADRLVLDPSLRQLRLAGHVRVWVDRLRLSSERLVLWTRNGAVYAEGPAELAFCPCPSPPLTLGFSSARLEPGDVFVRNPTLRAFGTPVFWLPALWLRSPARWGLLPLELAYRGDDGFLVGSGVHAPLGAGGLDVRGAGYLRGGADVSALLTTPRTSTFVRWDHLGDSALRLDARGALSLDAHSAMAWSVDALRGARALGGPSLLEEVALRQDRARFAAGFSDGGVAAGVAVEAASPRGAALSSVVAAGPTLFVGFGAPLGTSATASADASVSTWSREDATALTLLSERAALGGTVHAGPVAVDVEGRARGVATLDENHEGYAGAAALVADIAAPFVKELGGGASPLEHWVTPFVSGMAGAVATRSPSIVPALAPDGGFFVAAGGARTSLGERAGNRAAVSASLQAGYAGDAATERGPIGAWRVTGQGASFAIRGEGVFTWAMPRNGNVVLATLRAGPESGLFVEGRAEGASGDVPLLVRVLSAGLDAPWAAWLDSAGWSLGARVGVPWTRFLSSTAAADYDATDRVLLGLRGGLTYRHPCGCLTMSAWAGHRTGRAGADGFVSVGLVP